MTSRCLGLFSVLAIVSTLAINAIANANSSLHEFTSTRSVTAMAVSQNGTLWVGTRGGILIRDTSGNWTKQTMQNSFPGNEVQDISITDGGNIKVLFPGQAGIWNGQNWHWEKSTFKAAREFQLPKTKWQNKNVQATWNGLQIGDQQIKMPHTKGSYISALLPQEKVLLVAIYGDDIWSYDGNTWNKAYASLPAKAQEITALASDTTTKVLFVGTRRDGVWMFDGKHWKQHLQQNEPYNDNIQSLISFQGNLYASTLEDGLVEYVISFPSLRRRDNGTSAPLSDRYVINGKWQHFDNTVLSSNAPRQMAVFRNILYVRHGNGMVDRFDGEQWQRNIFPDLPRGKVYSLAADDKKLYLGQWGGWSEWDGAIWDHYLKIPQLQGIPVMELLPHESELWVGTQSLGLIAYSHLSQKISIIDARVGLSDDWITALAFQKHLFVGMFVGGLAQQLDDRWKVLSAVKGENITSLAADSNHGLYIATRHGTWHFDGNDKWQNLQNEFSSLAPEAQALLDTPDGLWIGTRTGLFFIPHMERNE